MIDKRLDAGWSTQVGEVLRPSAYVGCRPWRGRIRARTRFGVVTKCSSALLQRRAGPSLREPFRRLKSASRIAICTLSVLVCGVAVAKDRFPDPPDATIVSIGDDVSVYGMNVNARRFESDASAQQILAFYRQTWEGKQGRGKHRRDGYKITEVGPWQMISRLTDDRLLSVQVQPRGDGSWGYLGSTPLESFAQLDPDEWGGQFPRMRGSRVRSDVSHDDPGRTAHTLQLVNHFSVQGNTNFYKQHYTDRGWSTVMDMSAGARKPTALVFRKGRREVSLVIKRGKDDQTYVVVNKVENGLLR